MNSWRRFAWSLGVATLTALSASAQVEWLNLDETHHLAGRKMSEGYLQGKVVLVCRWSTKSEECRQLLPHLEAIWRSFRTQNFVFLGSTCKGQGPASEVKELVRKHSLTFPIYDDAALARRESPFRKVPLIYVVSPSGKVVYRGDNERMATDYVVGLLAKWETPEKLEDWKAVLDYEFAHLPAHALVHFDEFKQKYPKEIAPYAVPARALGRVRGMNEVKAMLKSLSELRDSLPKDGKVSPELVARIGNLIADGQKLKRVEDPQVSREAKNVLADLIWMKAEL